MTAPLLFFVIMFFASLIVTIRLYLKNDALAKENVQLEVAAIQYVKRAAQLENDMKKLVKGTPLQAKQTYDHYMAHFSQQEQQPILEQINNGMPLFT
jgi:cell division protein FtsB